jgi:hypothetical protein
LNVTVPRKSPSRSGAHVRTQTANSPGFTVAVALSPSKTAVTPGGVFATSTTAARPPGGQSSTTVAVDGSMVVVLKSTYAGFWNPASVKRRDGEVVIVSDLALASIYDAAI